MTDLYQAFLAQKSDLELRRQKREHLYWGLEPGVPWLVRAWRRLSRRRHRPAPRHTPRASRPGWTVVVDTHGGDAS